MKASLQLSEGPREPKNHLNKEGKCKSQGFSMFPKHIPYSGSWGSQRVTNILKTFD
jgi:hypothetical protein